MSKIIIVGEAWGEQEEKQGLPFVGQAGKVLDGVLEEIGLPRAICYITNVINERPPNNDFSIYYEKVKGKKVPTAKLLEAYESLKSDIVSQQPNVIVALGNEALKALTGLSGISDWRGSVLMTPLGKVIPTYHPSAVHRNWTLRPSLVSDLDKAARHMAFPEIRYQEPEIKINPSFEEVMQYVEEAKRAEEVAFDIETECEQITCIGLSYCLPERRQRTICVPFWFGASGSLWSPDEEAQIWGALRGLLESGEPKKIAHNGLFDCEGLQRTLGIRVQLHFDTMLAFHVLYPELPKALSYLISIYTDAPFHKHLGESSDMDTGWRYNGLDAALTLEVAQHVKRELDESGLEGFYRSHVHALISPLLDMQLRGVAFDTEARNRARKEYRLEIARLQTELERLVGHPLNVNSPDQMCKWLYEELKLKKVYNKDHKTKKMSLTSDEEALNGHIARSTDERVKEALKKVKELREKGKILSTYLEIKLDQDNRIRCSYNICGTETGRLSSSASTRGTGGNLQNIPDGVVKKLFRADPGKVLINADLSQAEARIVAYLADERRLIKVFEEGGDIHRKNASNIFSVPESDVSPEQRQLAKKIVHASHYGMGSRTFSIDAGIPETRAKQLLNQYFATYPRIKIWHMSTKAQLQRSRILTTPMGRRRIFFNIWSDSLLKEGLAFVPQSTVADMLNQGLICVSRIEWIELLLQVHDSIVCQVPESRVEEAVELIKQCLSVPVEINGHLVTIPSDAKVGYNWQEMTKYETWLKEARQAVEGNSPTS